MKPAETKHLETISWFLTQARAEECERVRSTSSKDRAADVTEPVATFYVERLTFEVEPCSSSPAAAD